MTYFALNPRFQKIRHREPRSGVAIHGWICFVGFASSQERSCSFNLA
jgi:hypothetical protein